VDGDRCVAELEGRIAVLERVLATRSIDPDQLYTPKELAERLTCGKSNVYELMKSGEIATTRVGAGMRGLQVRGSDITAFINARTEGGSAPRSTYKHLKGFLD
jgi:excisionase family DNA binding protein